MDVLGQSTFTSNVLQGSSDIKALVQQKEKELRDINEYRIAALEAVLSQKDTELEELRSKLTKVRDDFQYNLNLIRERDAELEGLEVSLNDSRQREAALASELDGTKGQLSSARTAAEAHRIKLSEMDAWYKQQVVAMKETLEAARASRTEELQSWRAQLEACRTDASARLRSMEAEFDKQKGVLREGADAALGAAQREAKKRDEQAAAAIRAADERAASALAQVQDAARDCASLKNALDGARAQAAEAQADAAAARAQLDTARAEFETTMAAALRDRDSAVSSRSVLLEEYERRMSGLLDSLRSVEQAFKDQKAEAEARITEVAARAAADAKQAAATFAAREATLLSRVQEAESSTRLHAIAADDARKSADMASTRAVNAEGKLEVLRRELVAAQQEVVSKSARLSAALESSRTALDGALHHGDDVEGALAKAQAELAGAVMRAEKAEAELAQEGSQWQERWQHREIHLQAVHAQALSVVQQQREALMHQVSKLTAEARGMKTVAVGEAQSTSALRQSYASADDDCGGGVDEPALPGPGMQDALVALDHLGDMESQLRQAKGEAAQARIDADKLRQQILLLETRLTSQQGDTSALFPDSDASDSADVLALRMELGSTQARCVELEETERRLRAVVSDMKAHAEELQADYRDVQAQLAQAQTRTKVPCEPSPEPAPLVAARTGPGLVASSAGDNHQLAEALAYKASAEALLRSMHQERDSLASDLQRAHAYIHLLQERGRECRDGGDQGGQHAEEECALLRQHVAELQDSVSSLRMQLRETAAQLAAHAGRQEYAAHGAAQIEVQQLNGRVQEMVAERDALLELSNSLRAQLHRVQHQLQNSRLPTGPDGPSRSTGTASQQQAQAAQMGAERAAKLEEALAKVTAQNAALHSDMRMLMQQLERRHSLPPPVPVPPSTDMSFVGASDIKYSIGAGEQKGIHTGREVHAQQQVLDRSVNAQPGKGAPMSSASAASTGGQSIAAPPAAPARHSVSLATSTPTPWDTRARKETPDMEGLSVSGSSEALISAQGGARERHGSSRAGVPPGKLAVSTAPAVGQSKMGRRTSSGAGGSVAGQADSSKDGQPRLSPAPSAAAPQGVRQIAEAKAQATGRSAGQAGSGSAPAWLNTGHGARGAQG